MKLRFAAITQDANTLTIRGTLTETDGDDDAFYLSEIDVRIAFSGGSGQATYPLQQTDGVRIPKILLTRDDDTGDFEIRTDFNELAQHLLEEIEARRQTLQATLANPIAVSLQADVFGAKSFTKAVVYLSPRLLEPGVTFSDDDVLLRISADQSLKFNGLGEADVDANLAVGVQLSVGDVKGFKEGVRASFDIDVPDLPGFDLRLPSFELKAFSLNGVDLPLAGFDFLPSFGDLPLPQISQFGKDDLKIVLNPANPKIALSVDGESMLIVTTDAPFDLTASYDGTEFLTIEGAKIELQNSEFKISTEEGGIKFHNLKADVPKIDLGTALPLRVVLHESTLELQATPGTATRPFALEKIIHRFPRIEIRAHDDPALSLHLALTMEYRLKGEEIETAVTDLRIIEPYPIELIKAAAGQVGKLIRLVGAIEFKDSGGKTPPGRLKVLERFADLLAAAARWMGRQAASAGEYLAGVAQAAAEALMSLIKEISKPDSNESSGFPALTIELRINPGKWQLEQVIVSPAGDPKNASFSTSLSGFDLTCDAKFRPALVADFSGAPWYGLVLFSAKNTRPEASLETDLWLSRDDGPPQPMGTLPDAETTDSPPRLVKISVKAKNTVDAHLVLAAVNGGRGVFFQQVAGAEVQMIAVTDSNGNEQRTLTLGTGGDLVSAELDSLVDIEPDVDVDGLKKRALAILPKPKPGGSGGPSFLQKVEITDVEPKFEKGDPPKFSIKFKILIKLTEGFKPESELVASVNLETFQAQLDGSTISIKADKERKYSPLGLELALKPKQPDGKPFEILKLDLSKGAERLSLGDGAKAELSYRRVSTSGKGLVFDIDVFGASRSGFDLDAKVKPEPVTLGGIDVPFRFTSGELSIKASQFDGASLAGSGQLPPALIGEANASIAMQLGRGSGGDIEVLGATARLDKSGDPIRCNATMFDITITELGFDFVKENSYHFYFLVTGNMVFRPSGGAFQSGLLKNFKEFEIKLDKAPLGADPRVLARAISFHVKVDPPRTTNFFDLFSFELRGIGFLPASDRFDDDPALVVSGQVKFAEFGDKISPRFDFHNMYIAGPSDDGFLPRVRFDGLGVGLKTGSLDVEATAIAVDGSMPDLYRPDVLPANVKAEGFLAKGKLDMTGWASMSAAMGFLELKQKSGPANPRHAFFLYGQANKLAEPIDTPVGRIYLREFGFGLGYRYTLAGISQAQAANSPRELVRILDEVSKYQGSLDTFQAWEPTYDNHDLTLALRGMFALSAASTSQKYNARKEANLPNPLLFDIVAALRTDLTFLINLRAWLAVNYNDWVDAGTDAGFKSNPLLSGYLYFSVPRKEFLARMISSPNGHVGEHPKLPDPLVDAIRAVRFSATLYIRPGLFHSELGWPYELGFDLGKPSDKFYLKLRGGLINRIEDLSMLYGMAFRAEGVVQFEGRVGNDNFGAAATARADFALDAKILAFLSLQRFDDSMFYGHFRFDLTLSVGISVWISFKIFRKRIRLSAGFSLHFAVAIGLEAVITPKTLGGRAHVAVGVRAFGRTLSVGIGLSFNDSALAAARARVARYMTLGLGTDIPPASEDGKRLEGPPRPNVPLKEVAATGDAMLDNDIGNTPAPAPISQDNADEDENFMGEDIVATDFWAMLFPVPGASGDNEQFVMQLLPRDLSELEPNLAKFRDNPKSTFFDAPMVPADPENGDAYAAGHTLEFSGDGELEILHFQKAGEKPEKKKFKKSDPLSTSVHTAVAIDPEDSSLKLGQLLTTAFLRRTEAEKTILTEPRPRFVQNGSMVLPEDASASAEALARIGRSRANMAAMLRREEQIEETRSAVLASIADTAKMLAQSGKVGDEEIVPALSEIDARDFGLTFVVTRAQLSELFHGNGDQQKPTKANLDEDPACPLKANFKVIKNNHGGAGEVFLFNPPSRMFRERRPALAPTHKITQEGIKLDWDLEPAWRASQSVYDDPEYHLKHYVIERRITGIGGNQFYARFTVKAVAPTEITPNVGDGKGAFRTATLTRPPFQFVDDLRSGSVDEAAPARPMPAALRDAILQRSNSGETVKGINIEYVIQPVDIAETSDPGEPYTVEITHSARRHLVSPIEATLQVVYDKMPSLTPDFTGPVAEAGAVPGLRLLLVAPPAVDPSREKQTRAGIARPPADGDEIALKLFRDRALPSGGFGADALTQGRSRPGEAQIDALSGPDVSEFVLRLSKERPTDEAAYFDVSVVTAEAVTETESTGDSENPERFYATVSSPAGVELTVSDLTDALHATVYSIDDESVQPSPGRSTRIFLKSMSSDEAIEDGEWRAVSPNIVVLAQAENAAIREPARLFVDAVTETFEQPVALSFPALKRQDLEAESGRLHVYRPVADATLNTLTGGQPGGAVNLTVDPARRTATRITWNARPRSAALKPGIDVIDENLIAQDDVYRWISGFELFQVDPDRLSGSGNKQIVYAEAAQQIGEVRLLPASERGLAPGKFGDYSRLECAFPSESWRQEPQPLASAVDGTNRDSSSEQGFAARPWLSLSESTVIFPRPRLRRTLLPEFDEGVISDLFALGRPNKLKVRISGIDGQALSAWKVAVLETGEPERKDNFEISLLAKLDSEDGTKNSGMTVAELRAHLRNLVLVPVDPSVALRQEDDALQRKLQVNNYLSSVNIELTAQRFAVNPNGSTYHKKDSKTPELVETGRVLQEVDLLPDLHPILADAIAFLPYTQDEEIELGKQYRRYSVVPDEVPPREEADFKEFADAFPPERDPHGHGTLRVLGLAAGFQLFDTESGDALRGKKLLSHVQKALNMALERYDEGQGDAVGVPFVDILTRPWGNAELYWFDGGQPDPDSDEVLSLLNNETLAAVQIALRPEPDRFAEASDAHPVRYARLKLNAKAAEEIKSDVDRESGRYLTGFALEFKPNPPTKACLLDVVSEASGIESLPQRRLTQNKDGQGGGLVELGLPAGMDRVPPGAEGTQDQSNWLEDQSLGYLRVASTESLDTEGWPFDESKNFRLVVRYFDPETGAEKTLEPKNPIELEADLFDPVRPGFLPSAMGRFTALSAADWSDVLFRPVLEGPEDRKRIELNPLKSIERLQHYTALRFGPEIVPVGLPDNVTGIETTAERNRRKEFVDRITRFWQRFLVYCGTLEGTRNETQFSLGTVADPGDWLQAPDAGGRLSVVIPDIDRRGARRAFAVRPFGRYRDWVNTALPDLPGSQNTLSTELRPGLRGALSDNPDLTQFIHTTLPRTEAPEKPVILAKRKVAVDGGADGVGRFEIVVAHTSDMILAEANQPNVAKMAPLGVNLGLWREFKHKAWLEACAELAGVEPDAWDPLAPFGRGDRPSENRRTLNVEKLDRTVAQSRVEDLRKIVPDAWRGSSVFSMAQLPYFFKTHVLVHTEAGIAVSDHATTAFEEGFPKLGHPFDEGPAKEQTAAPWYDVVQSESKRSLQIHLPVMRFIDAMSSKDSELWFGSDGTAVRDLKHVVHLPEPDVGYRLAVETRKPATGGKLGLALSRKVEIEIMPLSFTELSDLKDEKLYRVDLPGKRFSTSQTSVSPETTDRLTWHLPLALDLINVAPVRAGVSSTLAEHLEAKKTAYGEGASMTFGYEANFVFTELPAEGDWRDLFDAMETALQEAQLNAVGAALREAFGEPVGEGITLTLLVPAVFWADGDHQDPVKAFFGALPEADEKTATLVLNEPPTSSEISEVAGDNELDRLYLASLAAQQLFGDQGALTVLSMRGSLPPISAVIERKPMEA